MGYRPPVPQAELGPQLVKRVRHPESHHVFDVPSVDRPMTAHGHRRPAGQARGHPWTRVLAQPRSARRDRRNSRSSSTASSRRTPPNGSTRSVAAEFPEADGRVAGARRRQRLHAAAERGARSVRPPAGRARSRQAAVLRDGDADERRRHRSARREPRGAADQDRRQSGSSVEPRRDRRLRAGGDSRRSTTQIGRRHSPISGEIRPFTAFVGARSRPVVRGAGRTRGPDPDSLRNRRLADARGPDDGSSWRSFPRAKWVQWEPVGRHNAREGSRLAFGEYVDAQYALDKATVILSLDADFLCTGRVRAAHARAFASRRRAEGNRAQANRLYTVECTADQYRDHGRPPACRWSRRRSRRSRVRLPRRSASPARRGTAVPAAAANVGRAARQGSAGPSRAESRHRGRRPAADRPRAGTRDER